MSTDPTPYVPYPPLRPLLEQLYTSTYGCPPAPDADLSEQGRFLRFILPSPAHLDVVARVLAEEEA